MMAPKTTLGHYAFYCAPTALLKALRTGLDPNEADPDTGTTPLMWLCEMHDKHLRERKRMFRALLRAGAKLDAIDLTGASAWHYAMGASQPFRKFVRWEYRRITGQNPSRFVKRSNLS
jgi:ankyrin repeat protein